MRLTRIDAVRFGALERACLPEIGEGLTVVLGPNESGKSTYTALVRNVLFGFPGGRGKQGDRFYRPVAGERAGRLTFADETGEWAIDRVGDKKGGAVTVSALRGPERPGLREELVGDLKEQTYRVVFGFGLEDMKDIETGDDERLTSRLLGAGAGLGVSPLDVRAVLEKEATALFAPKASVPTINVLAARMRATRGEISDLERKASEYADEQRRAAGLADELAGLRARCDEAESRMRWLQRSAEMSRELSQEALDLADLQGRADEQEGLAADAAVDERISSVAAELGSLLEDVSWFKEKVRTAAALEAEAVVIRGRIDELGPLPADAADSVESRTVVEAWATRRGTLDGEARAAERKATQTEARAREYASGGTSASAGRARSVTGWIGLALLAVGAIAAAAGAATGQWVATALGALVAIAGAVLVVLRPAGTPLDLGAEALRLDADARAERSVVTEAAAALASEEELFRVWLVEHSLDGFGDNPTAVRELLDRLKSRAGLEVDAAGRVEAAESARAEASKWAGKVLGLVRLFLDVPQETPLEDVAGVAARAREALEANRVAADCRTRALESFGSLSGELERGRQRHEARVKELEAALVKLGIEPEVAVERLEVLAAAATEDFEEARGLTNAFSSELDQLRGRLDVEGRDAALALARQRLEGLSSEVAERARDFTVASLAVRLLDRARERYESERQPEVTRIASRVFSAMTDGRYTAVRVPIDGSAITVVTESGARTSTAELSRGTAEQLYLALRVGFLSSLDAGRSLPVLMDDVVVNFDAERRAGAATAIAELAQQRQVIFFTCHEETAEVLAEAVPGRAVIALDRCSLRE